MRSIPWMMTWEVLRCGRWSLPAALLGAIAFSGMLFAALHGAGAIQPEETHFVIMHVVLTLVNMMLFGAAMFAAQGKPARLYTLPAATSTLAAWRLAPAMAVTAIFSAITTATLNAVFDLGWPVWGPALFLGVAWGAVQATAWLAENSAWLPMIVAAVIAAPALWFKSQYGPTFGQPTNVLARGDGGRCGRPAGDRRSGVRDGGPGHRPQSPRRAASLDRIRRVAEPCVRPGAHDPPRLRVAGRGPVLVRMAAERLVMPTAVAFGMTISVAGWLIFSRDAGALFDGFVAGGGFLPIVGLLGATALGACGPREGVTALGRFSRPAPSPRRRCRGRFSRPRPERLPGVAIWAAPLFVLAFWLHATGGLPARLDLQDAWWYLPITLLGPWTTAAVGASLSLTGRPNLLAKAISGSFAAIIALTVFSELALSEAAQQRLASAAIGFCGVAFLAATTWGFLAARRRLLIERPTMIAAACVWGVLGTFAAVAASAHAAPIPLVLFLLGLAALVVAPVAAAPLALSWNRRDRVWRRHAVL
jgi:hypothetical protein